MNKLQLIFVLNLIFQSNVVFSEERSNQMLDRLRSKMLEKIESRISILENNKDYVNSARDVDTLKKCRESLKQRIQK